MNNGYLDMELLRFTTAGSVDDGKSTLIGRLLYDSKSIFEDQLEAVEQASRSRGNEEVNLALLTDGLRAEREQGITIDVAYRYFATPKRKFIIADTPESVSVLLDDDIDISRGDMLVGAEGSQPVVTQQLKMHCCWFNETEMQLSKRYILRTAVSETVAMVQVVDYYCENRVTGSVIFIDPDSFETVGAGMVAMNNVQ